MYWSSISNKYGTYSTSFTFGNSGDNTEFDDDKPFLLKDREYKITFHSNKSENPNILPDVGVSLCYSEFVNVNYATRKITKDGVVEECKKLGENITLIN